MNSGSYSIIDIGCGTGELLSHLAVEFSPHNLLGLDISKVGILKAQENYPNLNFALIEVNDEGFSSKAMKSAAEIIVCSEVLEHLEEPKEILRFISNNLLANGVLIVTVPAGPMSFLERYIGHHRHYTRESLTNLLEASGFSNIEVQRAGFPGINLIRIASKLRGKRILNDVAESQRRPIVLGFGLRIAEVILRHSLKDSKFGWQLVAVCNKKVPTSSGF
jgi:SAM-dependent methyltransferase